MPVRSALGQVFGWRQRLLSDPSPIKGVHPAQTPPWRHFAGRSAADGRNFLDGYQPLRRKPANGMDRDELWYTPGASHS
jgi:hypothetical protein